MKRNWLYYFKKANEKNISLLINYKKSLQFKGVNEKTIFEYQKTVYNFMLYLEKKDINTLDATVEILSEYMSLLDISEGRRASMLTALNNFWELNARKKYCKENIVEKYKNSVTNK